MPADPARLDRIRADLAYYRGAMASMQVGSQVPTLYADKYAEDVGYLLELLDPTASKPATLPKSELEVALDHDVAGRVERKPT